MLLPAILIASELASNPPSGGEARHAIAQDPWQGGVYVAWTLGLLAPFHTVEGVGSQLRGAIESGWWGPRVRLGVGVDVGLAGDCALCSPFSPWTVAEFHGSAGLNLVDKDRWAIWGQLGYGYLVARHGTSDAHFHVLRSGASWWWKLSAAPKPRFISLDVYADGWLGNGASPALGLGVSVIGPLF